MTGLPTLATDLFVAPTAVPLTEAMVGDAMQKAYTNGASPTLLVVPPGPKRTVSTFTLVVVLRRFWSARPRSCLL